MTCVDCWDHRLCLMAENEPAALAAEAMAETYTVRLTFIAEALGMAPWPIAKAPLLHLAKHDSQLVLEGVYYGLARHEEAFADADVRQAMGEWSAHPHAYVREWANEMLTGEP